MRSKSISALNVPLLVLLSVTLIEKGGKVRTVQYDSRYQRFIEDLVERNPSANIFAGLNQKVIYNQIKAIAGKSGFLGRGLHGMRKSFAIEKHSQYVQRVEELCLALLIIMHTEAYP